MKTRVCRYCNEEKTVNEFPIAKSRKYMCKKCYNISMKKYRKEHSNSKYQKLYTIENLEGECWKDIKGYEGLYQVSNLGRVKRLKYISKDGRELKEKLFSLEYNPKNYVVVNLTINSITKPYYVHRLVAEAFIPNPENKPQIDHINTIKNDNRVKNLRWVNNKENSNNPITIIHRKQSKSNYHSNKIKIIIKREIYCVELNKYYKTIKEASEITGINKNNICKVLNKHGRTAGGYRWEYHTFKISIKGNKILDRQLI